MNRQLPTRLEYLVRRFSSSFHPNYPVSSFNEELAAIIDAAIEEGQRNPDTNFGKCVVPDESE